MGKINAVIKGVGAYLPDYILTNHELSTMVDTSDEWIMSRVGIKERRILKDPNLGTSFLATKAVEQLLKKTKANPDEIEFLICATSTPDHLFPATAAKIANNVGIKNAFAYDIEVACAGFISALYSAVNHIESGRHKKIIVVAAEKMSFMIDYQDRTTCPLFGDGAAAVLVEATEEDYGVQDVIIRTDGSGWNHLQMKAGGSVCAPSHETVDNRLHYVYQEGQPVFKAAVTNMSNVSEEIMKRNNLVADDLAWFIPHQANLRIIDAVASRMGISKEKVMINIHKYANTSAATIPICLWELEKSLKKGDKIVCSTFGAGFTFGSVYLKWGYDGSSL